MTSAQDPFFSRTNPWLGTEQAQGHCGEAAGVAPGSEVSFSLQGGKIVITPLASHVGVDRRAQLRQAAARVRGTFGGEFSQLGADEIMEFLRGDGSAA